MIIKIIKNDAEYEEALELLSELIQTPYITGSDVENTIEILLLVIKDYEHRHIEPVISDPIEAIKFRMDQMNLKNKDMKPYLGSPSKVSEILNGIRPLSLSMIRKLHDGLGIPINALIGTNEKNKTTIAKVDYTLFPLKEMQARGYFGNNKKNVNDLKEYAEELVTEFCGNHIGLLDQNIAFLRAPLHLRGKKTINPYSLAIWQICVIKKSEECKALPDYNKDIITNDWLRELVKLSQYSEGCRLAKEYLANYGISLIIESHFNKTFLDGAAIMYNNKPIIALTLRHNRIDNFWFVLLHELAHLMHHMDSNKIQFFIDDLDYSNQLDEIEIEADAIANEMLIPKKIWESTHISKFRSYSDIESFAKKNHISPAIVAGRIRHCRGNYLLFPKLVNQPVIL